MKDYKFGSTYHISAAASTSFLVFIFLFSLLFREWPHVAITAGLLIIQGYLLYKRMYPALFLFLFPFTAFLYYLGSIYVLNLYIRIWFYDKIVHFTIEFVLTLLLGYVFQKVQIFKVIRTYPWLFFIILACIGITLGTVWEMFEWTLGKLVDYQILETTGDSITDLMIDSLGVILGAWLSLFYPKE